MRCTITWADLSGSVDTKSARQVLAQAQIGSPTPPRSPLGLVRGGDEGGGGGGPTVRAVGQISCSKSFSIVLKRLSEQSSGERAAIGGVGNVGCHDLRRTAPSCFYSFTNAVVVQ